MQSTFLEYYDTSGSTLNQATTKLYNGLLYQFVGKGDGKTVWGRLDKDALLKDKYMKNADLDVYETAMTHAYLSSGDTGSDGTKCEGSYWVVKLSIATAKEEEEDNTISPKAAGKNVVNTDTEIFLNFNEGTKRH